MKHQNYSNHRRFVPLYHFILGSLATAILIGSIVNLCQSIGDHERIYSASLIFAMSVALILASWFARSFAIKVQNRAIRAEENLRYFASTGKLLPRELKMSQIVALRFAPDEEFLDLTEKTISENLNNNSIKKEIKNWKADHHRA